MTDTAREVAREGQRCRDMTTRHLRVGDDTRGGVVLAWQGDAVRYNRINRRS